jgi:hypothetical protein
MDLEAIWKRARADLIIPTSRGETDVFLWEHSFRVARTAQYLLDLPEVRRRAADSCAVLAAALYASAGWAARCRSGEADRLEVLLGVLSEADEEESARIMGRSLDGLIPAESIQLAGRALRAIRDRSSAYPEAHVVADAQNLQEFGLPSLWLAIRRGMVEGRGVQSFLDAWRRKKEYRYWEARLSDAFRFQVSREIARARLAKLERLLDDMEIQHHATDIPTAGASPGAGPRTDQEPSGATNRRS